MNTVFLWLAGVLSGVYGAVTAFAGFQETRADRIQAWAAWSLVLCGLVVLAAGMMTLFRVSSTLWLLIMGLLGIHGLAINNGFKMFGRINPLHHLARLVVSAVLVAITYLGLK